ncbi:uncharacterized protein LOC110989000 [Acanthaster planci]|uniref:Uncharacterized protein LOC110989000 n=1 Tax=Acanthaster planci TaxID=133434 RepID=A0A8B7ZUH6_ACAPL|nr:uncharacterized protein LOC110989000 [Acanthaster planci]
MAPFGQIPVLSEYKLAILLVHHFEKEGKMSALDKSERAAQPHRENASFLKDTRCLDPIRHFSRYINICDWFAAETSYFWAAGPKQNVCHRSLPTEFLPTSYMLCEHHLHHPLTWSLTWT